MALEGKTFIQSDLIPEMFEAQAVAVDTVKEEAVLAQFKGLSKTFGKRMNKRVQPSQPTGVDIYYHDCVVHGTIADLSTDGVGVFTFNSYIYGNLPLEINAEVIIELNIPSDEIPTRLCGKIVGIKPEKGTYLHRLGFVFIADTISEKALTKYYLQRQVEIEQELKIISQSLSANPQKSVILPRPKA